MNERKGKGYVGKSMSVNAKNAYLDDEMPKSKWTKTAILQYFKRKETTQYGKQTRTPKITL